MTDQNEVTESLPPEHSEILALMRDGKKQQAVEACQAALEKDPTDVNAMSLLASLEVERGDFAAAEKLLRDAIQCNHLDPRTWINLGRLYQQGSRWAAAATIYEKALTHFPDNETLHSTLGQMYQRAGRFADAEAAFTRATELAPEKADNWMMLGIVQMRQERTDEAILSLNKSITLNPGLGAAYGNLGNALQKIGDLEKAEAAYETALKTDPDNGMIHVSLGMVRLRLGDPADAVRIFERSLAKYGPERRAAAWLPYARAQELGEMPAGTRAEIGRQVRRASLTPPPGFESVEAMNKTLAEALLADTTQVWEPAGKATRNGGQTGLLLDAPREPFLSFEKALRQAINAHFDDMKLERSHPYFGQIPDEYRLDIWGTLLAEQGHQHPHIHVGGWMSGVYYVALPDTMGDGEASQDGWIEFGRPPPDFDANFEPEVITYEPREGDAFFFPSYLFHRTLPFSGDKKRISIAFDVRPVSWRK
ncbi:MAG: tetratricopeptide repeat protein [Rhizobiales bacterium]|nr:tetratricopeptide repeat protein [Hyphomicrobiales bacterium]